MDLLSRHLPIPPARVLDVGGGPGVYAVWLAGLGYDVHLIDPVPLHVEQARAAAAPAGVVIEASVGDARKLPGPDGSADAVLLMGPLYHLTERDDRVAALAEARRVARPGGVVAGVGISRHASLLDGLVRRLIDDPRFRAILDRDLADGQHRNPTDRLDYFTTTFFHRPEDLVAEAAGSPARASWPSMGRAGSSATSPPASRMPPIGRCFWICCGGSRPMPRCSRSARTSC